MPEIQKPFKCNLHNNILTEDFFHEHKHLFPSCYFGASPMAKISIELTKIHGSSLVMLPFDYVMEAEAYGAEIIGYNDIFGLRTRVKHFSAIDELSDLPPMDLTRGRLPEIIKAVRLIDEAGYTACLNITGIFSLLEILLPIENIFVAWHKRQKVLLDFIARHERSMIEYITLALDAGAKVISYSDPLIGVALLGKKNSQQIAEELILPFFYKLFHIPANSIIHICGISSDILTAADVTWLEIELETEKTYSEAIIEQASFVRGIKFLGYGCLHHNNITKKLTQLVIKG